MTSWQPTSSTTRRSTSELVAYFPARMRAAYAEEIGGHRLRREIVATQLANEMINAGGPTYPTRMAERAAADVGAVARAYMAVRDSFALADLNGAIDGLDGAVTGGAQMALYRAAQTLLLNETVWFLRNASFAEGIGPVVETYRPAIEGVAGGARCGSAAARCRGHPQGGRGLLRRRRAGRRSPIASLACRCWRTRPTSTSPPSPPAAR